MSNRRFSWQSSSRRLPYLVDASLSLFAYIEEGHCHSKGDRNELPKYLRTPIVRFGSILMAKSVTASNIFHHSPERKLNGSSCERASHFYDLHFYVLTDLDWQYHAYVCVRARACVRVCVRVCVCVRSSAYCFEMFFLIEERDRVQLKYCEEKSFQFWRFSFALLFSSVSERIECRSNLSVSPIPHGFFNPCFISCPDS